MLLLMTNRPDLLSWATDGILKGPPLVRMFMSKSVVLLSRVDQNKHASTSIQFLSPSVHIWLL